MSKTKLFAGILALAIMATAANSALADWENEAALGFTNTNGNTEKTSLTISGEMKNAMDEAELLFKGDYYLASSDDKQDANELNLLGKYFYNFGDDYRWFNSFQVGFETDKFSNIDYRLTPAVGLGYHIYKTSDNNGMTWMADLSLGYQMTNYRDSTPDEDEAVLIAHTNFTKDVFEKAKIIQDLTVTPSLEENGVIVRSESTFKNPIKENVDLRVRYIIDHDTDPSPGVKKTDTQLLTEIAYKF